MFKSITYGLLTEKQVYEKIKERVTNKGKYVITIGTDSQSYALSRVVLVISVHIEDKGGFFFYKINYNKRFKTLHEKIVAETEKSIDLGMRLKEYLHKHNLNGDRLTIHVDIGKNGPTKDLISEIVGWITGSGFLCEIKPHSYTASTIADRLSK